MTPEYSTWIPNEPTHDGRSVPRILALSLGFPSSRLTLALRGPTPRPTPDKADTVQQGLPCSGAQDRARLSDPGLPSQSNTTQSSLPGSL